MIRDDKKEGRTMKPSGIVSVLLATVVLVASDVCAGATEKVVPPGQPFQELQQQIDALKQQVMGGYAVFDSTGKKVGDVIGMAEPNNVFVVINEPSIARWRYPVVVLEFDGKMLTLVALREALSSLRAQLLYAGQNCSGQAYVMLDEYSNAEGTPAPRVAFTSPLPLTAMPFTNGMTYVENGPPIPPGTTTVCSFTALNGTTVSCTNDVCQPFNAWLEPVAPVVDVGTLFTPPFTVKK